MSFSSFQNILPDPNNTIGEAGQAAGTAGPGFATVSLTSEQPTMKDFTNGGRLLARAIASHAWKIKIGYNFNTNGTPTPGDLFTVEDSANSNHLKAYMVTRVETNSNYLNTAAQPGVAQLRIHFTPGASKTMNAGAKLVFHNPLIKVISTKDIQQYALNTDNLYSYSLDLREVQ